MITNAIVAMLKQNSSLLAAVKSKGVPQIYHLAHEANTQNLPCIILDGEIATPEKVLSGKIVNYSGIYRVTIFAPRQAQADLIAKLVIESLHNKKGFYGTFTVLKMMLENRETLSRDPVDDTAPKRYGVSLDFDYRIKA